MNRGGGRRWRSAAGFTAAWAAVLLLVVACGVPSRSEGRAGDAAAGRATPHPTITPSPLVDPSEIVSGGPPRDGIPPIDDPRFVRASDVDWLVPPEPVIAVELNGDARAYPAQILIWHEIVNDTVGGVPLAITYCPLCNTGIAFERPTIDGRLLDFGTSGKLYRSNLVMYDRQTESLWPQARGQAVVGPLTGTELELVPVQMVAWEDWRAANPDGMVLSRATGHDRPYGENPYVGYDGPDSRPFLFDGEPDPRLPPKARVVGVRVGTDAVAFPYERLTSRRRGGWAAETSRVGGRPVVVFWKRGAVSAIDAATIADSREVGATGVFDPRLDGRLLTFRPTPSGIVDGETGTRWDIFGIAVEGPLAGKALNRIVSIESLWFDWAAFFPKTRVFGG